MGNKNLWTVMGHVKQVASQISIYFSVYSMLATSLILWHTTISPWLDGNSISISIWWFIIALIVIFSTLAVIEWKKSMPGFFRSWTQQFYTKDNPLRQDIETLKQQLEDLKNEIKNSK